MKNKLSKIFSLLLLCSLLICMALPAAAASGGQITHGTADYRITEDMLNNTPPADYKVNSASQADAREGKYNEFFLEDTLQTVSIQIDETNLNYLLQNAVDEPYVMTTSVTIGNTTLGYCGLKTKGAYTLAHAYTDNPNSDRFSFTVNFGKYIKKADYGEKQNFYGCDKISFNNFFFDKSMMKEFFALKLMDEMGLPTPQYGLAKLYINGNYYGVYFMVEAMDDTILEQYYNADSDAISSYLTKPEGTRFQYDQLVMDPSPLWEYDEDTYADVADMLPTVMEWARKLNCLSRGTDFDGNPIDVQSQAYLDLLAQVMNVDEVVRYFATSSWLCQMDNMFVGQKNFGLYVDTAGVCTLVPWDYDLSFGCYFPSTAEETANYPIDVMYQLNAVDRDNDAGYSRQIYSNFPLFHVIYQNQALMDKYHSYMKDCSRVAALGGTVEATGKSYDPGYFNSFIERMQEELIAAASQELADNVYYMNRIDQPRDVKQALPNLAKIIALRAVGVAAQVDGLNTVVTASGCNLETLGNALQGESSNSGTLTFIDPATGVFATAQFSGGRRSAAPSLTAKVLEEADEGYDQISGSISAGLGDKVLIYELSCRVKADSAYTLTVPLAREYMKEGSKYRFYSYENGVATPLEMTADGNLFTGTVDSLGHILVVVTPGTDWLLMGGIAAAVAAAAAAVTAVIVLKRKSAKKA